MTLRRIGLAIALLVALGGLVACALPVYDVKDAPVTRKLTADQVKIAIERAGATLGWQISEVQPYLLEGTLNIRRHVARVSIPYSAQSYSIVYKDSQNLLYDGTNIHKNYNGWIRNLDNGIRTQLNLQ